MNIKNKSIYLVIVPVLISIFLSVGFSVIAASDYRTDNPDPARVTTYGTRDTTPTSINLRGYISDDGGCADIYTWFEYGPTSNYGYETGAEYKNGIGYFSNDAIELEPCTTYHFRAVARNNTLIESYGGDVIFETSCASFSTAMALKNVTKGDTIWYDKRSADPGDDLLFRVNVFATGDLLVSNVMVLATLPYGLIYENDLKIDTIASTQNIILGGVSLGRVYPKQTRTITFHASVASNEAFTPGTNNLFPNVIVYNSNSSTEGTSQVTITKSGVAGASIVASATQVPTGIAMDVFNSVLIPLIIAIVLVWIFKSKLIGFDKWANKRKVEAMRYKAKKKLNKKILKSS